MIIKSFTFDIPSHVSTLLLSSILFLTFARSAFLRYVGHRALQVHRDFRADVLNVPKRIAVSPVIPLSILQNRRDPVGRFTRREPDEPCAATNS
jgi:hypothetical protein